MDNRPSNELQGCDYMTSHQISSPGNGHQGDMPYLNHKIGTIKVTKQHITSMFTLGFSVENPDWWACQLNP